MSTPRSTNESPVFFYEEDGKRADAEIHNPILEGGDLAAAHKVSREVAKEIGLTDAEIDSLMGK